MLPDLRLPVSCQEVVCAMLWHLGGTIHTFYVIFVLRTIVVVTLPNNEMIV